MGPPQSPKATKNTIEISRSHLAAVFIGKEGNNHLKSLTCKVPLIWPTQSPSWGGTSPICLPKGPPTSPEATKNTIKISRFLLAAVFIGKEGKKSPEICHLLSPSNSSYPVPHLGWSLTHLSPQGPPLRAPKQPKVVTISFNSSFYKCLHKSTHLRIFILTHDITLLFLEWYWRKYKINKPFCLGQMFLFSLQSHLLFLSLLFSSSWLSLTSSFSSFSYSSPTLSSPSSPLSWSLSLPSSLSSSSAS